MEMGKAGMTSLTAGDLRTPLSWPEGGVTRVPYRLYADAEIYALEQQRIFCGPVWNFLGLEIQIPNPGDYRTTHVGEIPVIVVRDENGEVNAMVNRCAHKGALVCLAEQGNANRLTCIYHACTYDLQGRLKAIAFRNGVNGAGGMPADFDQTRLGLQRLRVEVFCGMIFGTFADATPPVPDFL